MCPEVIQLCYLGNWSLMIEALYISVGLGLTLGFVVGLIIFSINKKG